MRSERAVFPHLHPTSGVLLALLTLLGVSCRPDAPLFTELSPEQTGIAFVNDVPETEALNVLTYPYFYNGGGVVLADFDNDGLTDVFLTANRRGGNRLYRNRGQWHFEDVTRRAGVAGTGDWSTGATVADVNADGWLDLYVCGVNLPGRLRSRNALFVNQQDGTFREEAPRYGLDFRGHSTQSAFFDYDHDGDLDCFLLNHAASLRDDYRPAEDRLRPDSASGSRLYAQVRRPDGRIWFENVTQRAGLFPGAAYGLGLAVGDANGDGWEDLYVANDFREHDFFYLNTGRGEFRESGDRLLGHSSRFSMGCVLDDYDNDGRPDLITLDMLPADERELKASAGDDEADTYAYKQGFGFRYQVGRNTVQKNLGPAGFSDRAWQLGLAATDWSWCPLLADFTNDGRKDLLVTNGIARRLNDLDFARFVGGAGGELRKNGRLSLIRRMPEGRVPAYFFEQTPTGFADSSVAAGFGRPTLGNGAAYADLDGDGDLDVVINRRGEPAGVYRNDAPQRHFLQLQLVGPPGNAFGFGARADVWANRARWQGEVMPTRGFQSAVWPLLHVGLGATDHVDSLVVRWNERETQTLRHLRADGLLVIRYAPDSLPHPAPPPEALPLTDVTASAHLTWRHREDAYDDFARNPFIPHRVSTQGPRLAVGDVNRDGYDDAYVGGAKGQAGALLVQQPDGRFVSTNTALLAADADCEDTDALFFDADADGDLDLYVVSGGGEAFGTDPRLRDRLYRNDGRGCFAKDTLFPALYENKSCVRAADFDHDGDLDLFVGGRVNARQYGATPTSALLLNDGRGHFSVKTPALAPGLETVGMVTDARWCDLDGDGWTDLAVVGHWMPLTVFRNERGRLRRQPPDPATSGLWNCLLAGDFDRDGDQDLLAGNWGLNGKLTASPANPLRLYLHDFDDNGEVECLLTLSRDGEPYSFLGKDKLEARLPVLKKKFLTYRSAAGLTAGELFGTATLDRARVLRVETLASALFRNEGGRLRPELLPADLQAAPVFCLLQLGPDRFVAGGNFFGVTPYEGRYDALPPLLFSLKNRQTEGFLPVRGELRGAALLRRRGAAGRVLLAFADELRLYALPGGPTLPGRE
jgi:hypothetical protein